VPNINNIDPQNPTDLLGRPIAEGDIVAWGTTYGRSPAVCVAKITKIRFIQRENKWSRGGQEVEQAVADSYTLRLQPILSTGSTSSPTRYHRDGWTDPADGKVKHFEPLSDKPKEKNVQIVKNIVKLDLTEDEATKLASAVTA
jgi:hypothetical protein